LLEADTISLLQRPISVSHNPGVVDEDVGSVFAGDKPIALGVVEPLDPALYFHYSSKILGLTVPDSMVHSIGRCNTI
jgi:hypothetical protein